MKEQIQTIPVNEAFQAGDECPFCWLERKAEQSAIRYVAGNGASYMEPDVRGATDAKGFCREHLKKLHDYGNILGCALMLQTHYAGLLENFRQEQEGFAPPAKKPLFGKKKAPEQEPYWQRLQHKTGTCYLCDKINYNMDRYYATFFTLLREPEFRQRMESGKGFCLHHFAKVLELAEDQLPNSLRDWFYPTVFSLMEENLTRVKEDLDWFVGMFDYRQQGADWKNSRDAVPRTMQKLRSGYPADPTYKKDP